MREPFQFNLWTLIIAAPTLAALLAWTGVTLSRHSDVLERVVGFLAGSTCVASPLIAMTAGFWLMDRAAVRLGRYEWFAVLLGMVFGWSVLVVVVVTSWGVIVYVSGR